MAAATSVVETVEAYMGAINERDEASRARLLETAVTDDFIFTGVVRQTQGREAFHELVGEILSASSEEDGEAIIRTSEVDGHHGWVHFRWALRNAQGVVIATPEGEQMAGWYVGQLASDGRLERIVVFLGSGEESATTSEEEAGQAGSEQEGGTNNLE